MDVEQEFRWKRATAAKLTGIFGVTKIECFILIFAHSRWVMFFDFLGVLVELFRAVAQLLSE